MSTIPFVEARFFDPKEGRIELETRFETHLHRLRGQRLGLPPDNAEDENDNAPRPALANSAERYDEARIKRRVKRILECRKAASGLEHLKRDDRERLEVLKDGARLISIRNEHHADELAAALHEDMPWMAPATEVVWHAMRRSWREALRASGSRHSCSTVRPALAKAVSAEILPRCWPRPPL